MASLIYFITHAWILLMLFNRNTVTLAGHVYKEILTQTLLICHNYLFDFEVDNPGKRISVEALRCDLFMIISIDVLLGRSQIHLFKLRLWLIWYNISHMFFSQLSLYSEKGLLIMQVLDIHLSWNHFILDNFLLSKIKIINYIYFCK